MKQAGLAFGRVSFVISPFSLLAVFLVGQLGLPICSHAIGLDSFAYGVQSTESKVNGTADTSLDVNLQEVIGGSRLLVVTKTSGPAGNGIRSRTDAGTYFQSQDSSLAGKGKIVWDARVSGNGLSADPTGLGSINFTEDGGTAFVLRVQYFDNAGPTNLSLRLFTGANGSLVSTVTKTISALVDSTPVDITFPFNEFTGANLTKVGAVELEVDGLSKAVDIELMLLATNGQCPNVPNAKGEVYDVCGVCGGDGTSCLDCKGVPNGPDVPGSNCNTGLPGHCGPGVYNTGCYCAPINGPEPETCDQIDNDCDGKIDENYPLVGQDCGTAADIQDPKCQIHGTYVCDQNGALKCEYEGDLDLGYIFENCGQIIGCDRVPNSGLVEDICGICGGDGSVCDGCSSTDIGENLGMLDSGAKAQEGNIIISSKLLARAARRAGARMRPLRADLRSIRAHAHDLQIENWVLSWTFPRISVVCPDDVITCVDESTQPIKDGYTKNAVEMFTMDKKLIRRMQRYGVVRKVRLAQRKKAKGLYQDNMRLLDLVPDFQSKCSVASLDR